MEKVLYICLIGAIALSLAYPPMQKVMSYAVVFGIGASMFYMMGQKAGEREERERQRKIFEHWEEKNKA